VLLSKQIEENQARKESQKLIDQKYYKPHFGPEETDELLDQEWAKTQNQKHLIRSELLSQMNEKKTLKDLQHHDELTGELDNLRSC